MLRMQLHCMYVRVYIDVFEHFTLATFTFCMRVFSDCAWLSWQFEEIVYDARRQYSDGNEHTILNPWIQTYVIYDTSLMRMKLKVNKLI